HAVTAQAWWAMSLRPPMRRGGTLAAARAAEHGPDRRERVAGDPPGPDQFPQSGFQLCLGRSVGYQLAEEVRAAAGQGVQDRAVGVGELDLGGPVDRQRQR